MSPQPGPPEPPQRLPPRRATTFQLAAITAGTLAMAALAIYAATLPDTTPPLPPNSAGAMPGAMLGPTSSPASPAPSGAERPPTAENRRPRDEATLEGVVTFTGKPPEMKVPAKRKDADFCKKKDVLYNAVLVHDGKLQDAFIRIAAGGVPGTWKAPEKPAELRQIDCMYTPRVQGVVSGQTLVIRNGDETLHNAHTYLGTETLWGTAQPKGAGDLVKEVPEEPTILKITCDVHPWMRGFVVVTDHPFFALTGPGGGYRIEHVPAGTYTIEAWHSHYGLLRRENVAVQPGGEVTVDFSYDDSMREPPENTDELKGLW